MILIIAAISILLICFLTGKKTLINRFQIEYEKALLKGDRKKATQLGKIYYLSLDETTRTSKGIVNIDEKISEDFRSFNTQHFSIFF